MKKALVAAAALSICLLGKAAIAEVGDLEDYFKHFGPKPAHLANGKKLLSACEAKDLEGHCVGYLQGVVDCD